MPRSTVVPQPIDSSDTLTLSRVVLATAQDVVIREVLRGVLVFEQKAQEYTREVCARAFF